MTLQRWRVHGQDTTPDGYHDEVLYEGNSAWKAWRAYLDARGQEGMKISILRRSRRHSILVLFHYPPLVGKSS